MVKPYTIAFNGYYHMSGGIRALHVLQDEIMKRGIPAFMSYQHIAPNSIVVYPEITQGNPLNAEQYVRWLLNKADFPDDTCYAWESGMGDYPLLTVNIVEMNLWKPTNEKSGKVAYWVGKGVLDPSILPPDAIEISRNNLPTRSQLAAFVSGLDYLISFDPFTAVICESVVCGTPVLVHSNDTKWTSEAVNAHGWYPYGVAWSPDQMDHARSTVSLARDHYESLIKVFDTRIDNFIENTQRG